jgi:uncharacterized protein (DUF2236 family)
MPAPPAPPGNDDRNLCSQQDHERAHEALSASTTDPRAGIFGPDSLVWQINREALIFVGSGRAALLQLAHPYVAEAIEQHSDTRDDPFGRFHRTFRNVFTMVYGDLDQALASARHVYRVHQHIEGHLSEALGIYPRGHRYHATEFEALLWVHATLWETSIATYELLVRTLTADEKERYYQETCRFAALFGLHDNILPRSWNEFERYNQEMWRSLEVGRAGREIGRFLFEPHLLGAGPAFRWLEIMTAATLPENLRAGFGLELGRFRRVIFKVSVFSIRLGYRLLPGRLRFVPPYIAGLRRARGDTRRDRLGEWLMRLWLGR